MVRGGALHCRVEPEPEADEDPKVPEFILKVASLVDHTIFRTVMMLTIVVAGVLVGAQSYLDCGVDPATGLGYVSCRADPDDYVPVRPRILVALDS